MKVDRNRSFTLVIMAFVALLTSQCTTNPASPGVEFMPDMYRSVAFESYAGNSNYTDSMGARLPVEGSIAQGYLPYGIPKSDDGYQMAGALLKNPLPNSEQVIGEGKIIYMKYCGQCHGKEGNGDGPTVTAGGHPPPPAYTSAALANLPEGKMFHTITYGRNLMGPHASQLNVEERWKVIRYVEFLRNPEGTATENSEENTAPSAVEAEGTEVMDETAINN